MSKIEKKLKRLALHTAGRSMDRLDSLPPGYGTVADCGFDAADWQVVVYPRKVGVKVELMMDYEPALKSMTKGRGSYTMELSHYDPVPERVAQDLVTQHAQG